MSVQTSNLSSLNASLVIQTDVATLPSPTSVGVQIGGNWTGTLTFQATIDQVNWFNVLATPVTALGGNQISSTTSNGQFAIAVVGFAQVQVTFTSYSAGTAVVSMDVTSGNVSAGSLINVQTQSTTLGGPPLASGLPGGITSDSEVAYQAKDNTSMILIPTIAGQSSVTFIDNPWLQGMVVGSRLLLSLGPNAGAAEEVVVGTNNIPSATVSAITINLVNPVVNSGLNYALFDDFDIDGPNVPQGAIGATTTGVKGQIQYILDPRAQDPKRPMYASTQAPGAPGVPAMIPVVDPTGGNDLALMRQILQAMLIEIRALNMMVAQLKDGGSMEMPAGIFASGTDSVVN